MIKTKQKSVNELLIAMTVEEDDNIVDSDYIKYLKNLIEDYTKGDGKEKIKELYLSGHSLTGKKGIRYLLGALDMEFFGRAYFPHYFSKPAPIFHKELDSIWQAGVTKNFDVIKNKKKIATMNGTKHSVAAPRGHAKSTTLTFKGTIHAVLYEYKHYPIIISDSSDQAESFLDNIKSELEENSYILEDIKPFLRLKALFFVTYSSSFTELYLQKLIMRNPCKPSLTVLTFRKERSIIHS